MLVQCETTVIYVTSRVSINVKNTIETDNCHG